MAVADNISTFVVAEGSGHNSGDLSGNYIFGAFFLVMLLLFLLDFFGGTYIQRKLWDSDVRTTREVCPRIHGVVTRCGGITVLAAFCIVSLCTHNYTLSCLFAVASIVFGSMAVRIFRISIQYDEKAIFFKSGKQIQQFPVESLQRIQWEEVRRTTGFSLVLYFWGGSKVTLQQADFIGLRTMAEYYKEYLTRDTAM